MAISVTGGVTALVFDGADPAGQNVTVPGDTKAACFGTTGWSSGGWALNGVSLGGVAMSVAGIPRSGDASGVYWAILLAPATGTLSLDPVYSADPGEGPISLFVCLTATGDISIIDRDFDSNGAEGVTASATSASNTGDFALAIAEAFGATPTHNGVSLGSEQTNTSQVGQLFTLTAGAATTNATSAGDYPSVGLAILRDSGGGGGGGGVVVDHQSTLSFPALCRRPANDNWKPPGRRSVAESGQFRRSKSGIYLPRRLAA